MVRNMDGRRWDRNRMLTLLAATLLLAAVMSLVLSGEVRPRKPASTAVPAKDAAREAA